MFWIGVVGLYVVPLSLLLGQRASELQRLATLLGLGLSLYVVKVLNSPLRFSYHDEFGSWRVAQDLVSGA